MSKTRKVIAPKFKFGSTPAGTFVPSKTKRPGLIRVLKKK